LNVTTNAAKFFSSLCIFELPLKNIKQSQRDGTLSWYWYTAAQTQARCKPATSWLQVWHSTTWPLVHQIKIKQYSS